MSGSCRRLGDRAVARVLGSSRLSWPRSITTLGNSGRWCCTENLDLTHLLTEGGSFTQSGLRPGIHRIRVENSEGQVEVEKELRPGEHNSVVIEFGS